MGTRPRKTKTMYLINAIVVLALNLSVTFALVMPVVKRVFPKENDRLARNTIMIVAIFATMASINWVLSKAIRFLVRERKDA